MKTVRANMRVARRVGLALVLVVAILGALLPSVALAAPSAPQAESDSWHGSGNCYFVKRGDTLSQIAVNLGVSVHALMQANGIRNPNHIYVGQCLVIPGWHDAGHNSGQSCANVHWVRHGQTLSWIAQQYGVSVHALMQANGIRNPNHIYAGQKLCIPGGWSPPPDPKPQPPPRPQPPVDGCQVYVVQRGDTLSRIARWHGTTVQQLMAINNLWNPNHIYVGQVLKISCPTPPPPDPCRPHGCPPPPPPDPCPCPPVPEPSGFWTGHYFPDRNFGGSPVIRQDPEVNFRWGTNSPVTGIPSDQFSVRWERTVFFDAGTYRFEAGADDGVRVFVDGIVVIDEWREQPFTWFARDAYVGGGNHTVRVEFYEEGGEAGITVRWVRLDR